MNQSSTKCPKYHKEKSLWLNWYQGSFTDKSTHPVSSQPPSVDFPFKGALELLHVIALPQKCFSYSAKVDLAVMGRNDSNGKEWHHRYITPCYLVKDKSDQRRAFSSKFVFPNWGATTDYRKGPFYQIKTNLLHEDNAWFDLQSTEVFTLLRILEEILNSQESWHSTAHAIKHPSKYV